MKFIHTKQCRDAGGQRCDCLRSHGYTVQRELKVGDLVTLFDDFKLAYDGEVVMLPGMVAKLEGFTNAGFNGIYAHIRVNGQYIPNISAGRLRKADDGESAKKVIREELDRRMAVARQALTDALEWAAEHGIPEDEVVERVGRTRA